MPSQTWEPPAVRSFDVLPTATGMGPACPFRAKDKPVGSVESLPLVFETTSPIASKEECQVFKPYLRLFDNQICDSDTKNQSQGWCAT